MIMDKLLEFDPFTVITATRVSTNVLDVGVLNAQNPSGLQQRDMGPSYTGDDSLDVLIQVGDTALDASGSATLTVAIQAAVDAGSGGSSQVPGTFYDQVTTTAIGKANLIAGTQILRVPLPRWQIAVAGVLTRPRFYRINYTVATGPFTAGSIGAWLISSGGRQDNYSYLSGFNAAN